MQCLHQRSVDCMCTCQEGAEILAAGHYNCLAVVIPQPPDISVRALLRSLTGKSDKCCLLQGNGGFWHSLKSACSAHEEVSAEAMLPGGLPQLAWYALSRSSLS